MTEPFEIRVPEAVLEDLHDRLARARVPDSLPGYGWEQGTEAGYLREVLDYWRQGYDWRKHEQVLNRMAHFRAGPAGGRIHFIHQRAAHPGAKPLLLIHGWPGSVFEFYKLIPRLTHPERHGGRAEDGLHVVAPSLPGYGFSDAPREPGFTPRRVGRVLHQLMHDTLGYRDYVVQGGDWGAVIGSWIAHDFGPACAGLHLNMVGLRPAPDGGARPFTAEEEAFLAETRRRQGEEMAYQAIQATRPQSLGYGLNDSPAGLAAWLIEKFRAWSDCGGELERSITRDELLTNVMIYWVTGTITSSMRLYYENRHQPDRLGPGERVECPTAYADFPREIYRPPRSWVERAYRIERWSEMKAGGHFAALEEPQALAADMLEFFSTLPLPARP